MKVAVPRMGEIVAPCLGHCAMMSIFTIENDRIADQLDFPLSSEEPLDRIRLLRDQKVETLICGGMQDVFASMLSAHGIKVISWVSGNINDLLKMFLRGQLVPGSACADRSEKSDRRTDKCKGPQT